MPVTYLIIKRRVKVSESIPSLISYRGLQKKLPEILKYCIKSQIRCKINSDLSQTAAQVRRFTKKEENFRKIVCEHFLLVLVMQEILFSIVCLIVLSIKGCSDNR